MGRPPKEQAPKKAEKDKVAKIPIHRRFRFVDGSDDFQDS
jgi:hypothetical protein